ncbi:MAG: hypothetical protein BWY97_00071 [Tenericutes bacterium ADurb.BinA124]|nr:MAG: hypothetical protein BWY97_00071 [Tenericutes bacterium ADurb.BinA124]
MNQQTNLNNIQDNNIYNLYNNLDDNNLDNINIYYIYNNLRVNINKLSKELKETDKALIKLIQDGGPKPVKAQAFEPTGIRGSAKITPERIYFQAITDLMQRIANIELQLQLEKNKLKDLIDLINQASARDRKNLELQVFIECHIKHESLYNLSKRLYRTNEGGKKVFYNYGYLRQINMAILKKMQKK